VRAVAHPQLHGVELADVLHALSDPVRLEIVRRLAEGEETPCGCLCQSVSKSTLSHHLKVLREAGLTQTRANGTSRFVSLREAELESRFPGLLDAVLQRG
jgi:DNA-binding transcriptional ArsR family regulator